MTRVLVGESLAFENVTKVPVTVFAKDFSSPAVSIGVVSDSALDFVVEAWPAAARMELSRRLIKCCVATAANVSPCLIVVVEFARAGALRSLVLDDVGFLVGKLIEFWHGNSGSNAESTVCQNTLYLSCNGIAANGLSAELVRLSTPATIL